MNFIGRDKYFRESPCGYYRVAKAVVMGIERYEAWVRDASGWHPLAVNLDTVEQARDVCESHAEQLPAHEQQAVAAAAARTGRYTAA